MYEIEMRNIHTDEMRIEFGYSVADAYKRSKLDPNAWAVVYCVYMD